MSPSVGDGLYLLAFSRQTSSISTAANKELVARFYDVAINDRDVDACARFLTKDFVHNGEARGQEGQRQAVAYFLGAFPDLRHTIEFMLAEGDLVSAHQSWRGTQRGSFLGVDPTDREIEFSSTAILRIDGDRIAEAWDEVDMMSALMQLGVLPSA